MKYYYNEIMLNPENYLTALNKYRKSVHWKKSIQEYSLNAVYHIKQIIDMMQTKNWNFKSGQEFTLNNRGKIRHIHSLCMDEKLVQRVLHDNVLYPLISPKFIYDNGASLKGKGISFTRERVITHLREYSRKFGRLGYVLRLDIKNFYGSINHNVMKSLIKPILKDNDLYNLYCYFLEEKQEGMDLGNQLSLISGSYLLTFIDRYIKEELHCKYYGRYMDDIYIIHNDREFLKTAYLKIKDKLNIYKLQLNTAKCKIYNTIKGFSFLKVLYKITDKLFVLCCGGKETVKKFKRTVVKLPIDARYNYCKMIYGNIKQFNSVKLKNQIKGVSNDIHLQQIK